MSTSLPPNFDYWTLLGFFALFSLFTLSDFFYSCHKVNLLSSFFYLWSSASTRENGSAARRRHNWANVSTARFRSGVLASGAGLPPPLSSPLNYTGSTGLIRQLVKKKERKNREGTAGEKKWNKWSERSVGRCVFVDAKRKEEERKERNV